MIRTRLSGRPGMTMIELLVVIGMIIVLASLLVMISPKFAEDQRTTRGADQIQGWLLVAKQRSYRDQLPRGIRLVRASSNPAEPDYNRVRELIYIERPEDLRGEPDPNYTGPLFVAGDTNHNHIQVPIPVPPYSTLPPAQRNQFVFIPNWDLRSGDLVLPGDFLKINTYETQPYNIHRIGAVPIYPFTSRLPNQQPVIGTVLQLAAGDGPGGSAGTPSFVVPNGQIAIDADTRYQIIRQARPLTGEPTLQLPRDVIIDLALDPNTNASRSILPGFGSADELDILFSQRGQVMGSNANNGKIVLRVRQGDKPDTYGEQIYIVTHTRTGLIVAHPVNLSDPLDPFKFTRDGKDSGM